MSYRNYDIEDFASDPKFREWVLSPNPDINFFWEKWMMNNPEKRAQIEKAKILVATYLFQEQAYSKEEKEDLLARIDKTIEQKQEKDKSNVKVLPIDPKFDGLYYSRYKSHNSLEKWLKVAVVLIGIMASSIFITKTIMDSRDAMENQISMVVKDNPVGRRIITLPDGSTVTLNAQSKVSYPSEFSEFREIELTGEAFFEVVEDKSRPFIVKTDGITTQVLGTSFNVKAYPGAEETSVSLVSGKVLVKSNQDKSKELVLSPGEAAGFNKKTREMIIRNFDYMEEITWKDGTLYFRETPVKEVFNRLEKWYGVTFHYEKIPNEIKPISGSFTDEYLDNVLESIGYTVKFDFEIEEKDVYVQFKN